MDSMKTATTDDAKAIEAAVTLPMLDITASFPQAVDPISDEMFDSFGKIINTCGLAICLTGICTNVLSLRTFYRMGLEDSMTISFFFLAVCDFGTCIIVSATILCDICNILVNENVIKVATAPYIPFFYISSSRAISGMLGSIIKDYMAIQRCLCVALPFIVKGLFTRFRTFLVLGISSPIISLWALIYICGHTVQIVTIPAYNITYPTIGRREGLGRFVRYYEFTSGVLFSAVNQIITVTCLIIMVIALKKSATFRRSATTSAQTDHSRNDKSSHKTANLADKSNSKEKQALIQVAFLTGIFSFAVAPHFAQGLASVLIPDYTYNRTYHNMYMTVHGFALLVEMMHAAGNFFVYLKYNSKFRKYLLHFHTIEKK